MLVGNKLDLASDQLVDTSLPSATPSSLGSTSTITAGPGAGAGASSLSVATGQSVAGSYRDHAGSISAGTQQRATVAPEGREISSSEANHWANAAGISVVTEASAFNGEGVDEIFGRLARMILTKIELGDVDPDDPMSGIQYGDSGPWNTATASDGGSIKSTMTGGTIDEGGLRRRRRGKSRTQNWGLREWEEVFTLSSTRRRGGGCC